MLDFSARVAARDFEVEVSVATGETLAILGPNGSGKSTLLESIAGLLRPDAGSARLDGRVLFDLGPARSGAWVPAHRRSVSLLAQNAMLFPRMTARDNVAFGPRSSGARKRAARERAALWLDRVDATALADRTPAQLSGGQAQRIAIARALASEPALLLLDEPMAALDVTVTPALRRLLREVLAEQTAILVTHDVLDAYTLADRVAVINAGHVVEIGATREVFERPRSPFTAALVGLNLLTGIRTAGGFLTAEGRELRAGGAPGAGTGVGAHVGATVSPSAVSLTAAKPAGAGARANANAFESRVAYLEPRGDLIRVTTDFLFADVPPAAVADLDLVAGMSVWTSFAATDLTVYGL